MYLLLLKAGSLIQSETRIDFLNTSVLDFKTSFAVSLQKKLCFSQFSLSREEMLNCERLGKPIVMTKSKNI